LTDGTVDAGNHRLCPALGSPILPGDPVTVDGHAGVVYRGRAVPATPSVPVADPDVSALLPEAADGISALTVRVSADTAQAARSGRDLGATGVGLCRIEHMFLGEHQRLLERALLARSGPELSESLAGLRTVLKDELTGIFGVMDRLPVAIRLLDPPRHEF